MVHLLIIVCHSDIAKMKDLLHTQAQPGTEMPDIPTYMNIRTFHIDSWLLIYRFQDGKFTIEQPWPAKIEEDQDYFRQTAVVLMEPNTPAVDVCLAFDFPEPLRMSCFT